MNICCFCSEGNRRLCEKNRIEAEDIPLETYQKAFQLHADWGLYAAGLCVFG